MPVCITGMHRSGTSMVAKLLHDSGLYLGPTTEIMPAAEENPEGFWENIKFVELNEELLSRLGGGWDCPPPATSDWSDPAIAALRPAASGIVQELAAGGDWGWKDPRTCFTLPFWQSLLGEIKVVLVLRNPLEVARSLRERNGFSYALGLTLWRLSYQRVMEAVPAADRVVTHFDAYFAQPEVECQRLLGFLGRRPAPGLIAAFRDSNAGRLRHHRFNQGDLAAAGIDPAIRDLYQALCREAEWPDTATAPGATPNEYGGRHLGAFDTTGVGIGGASRLTIENGVLRQELAALHDDYHHDVEHRDARIDDLQATIAAQAEATSRAEAERHELERLRALVREQREQLITAEARITAANIYEDDIRELLTSAHQQLAHRDAEVMATLGIALARHAPAAPAAIYYRQLLARVKATVAEELPAGAPVAVATLGDDAMLQLDGRPAWHFPPAPENGAGPDDASLTTDVLLAQLDDLRGQGAEYLVMPAVSASWAARIPKLTASLERRFPIPVRVSGTCRIYDLREPRSD